MLSQVCSEKGLEKMVQEYGFMPVLKSCIPGFSVEDHTSPECWFVDGVDGPWEWKGPVIRRTGCAYGKFFCGKAGFITRGWFPDFANYRRGGYDIEERYGNGLLRHEDKVIYDVLAKHRSLISKEWRRLAGFHSRSDFDAAVNRLQMMGYVTTVDFEYSRNRRGEPYGWGLARYSIPETHFGEEFASDVYKHTPEESYKKMLEYLKGRLPDIPEKSIRRLIG